MESFASIFKKSLRKTWKIYRQLLFVRIITIIKNFPGWHNLDILIILTTLSIGSLVGLNITIFLSENTALANTFVTLSISSNILLFLYVVISVMQYVFEEIMD